MAANRQREIQTAVISPVCMGGGREQHREKCNFPALERKRGELVFLALPHTSFLILILKTPVLTKPMAKSDIALLCPWDTTQIH